MRARRVVRNSLMSARACCLSTMASTVRAQARARETLPGPPSGYPRSQALPRPDGIGLPCRCHRHRASRKPRPDGPRCPAITPPLRTSRASLDRRNSRRPMCEANPDPQRWKALTFISVAQLMVILDGTIVNIALPRMQADLGFSDADRAWVVTAYTLAFGGLLLLGGRLGDLLGRKRVFLVGLVGFAFASALGGAATGIGMLLGARTLQGVFGALLAPAALSLVATTFTQGRERATIFGVFSS